MLIHDYTLSENKLFHRKLMKSPDIIIKILGII